MCAKMLDPEFNKGIEVVVLPNLYGDIVTDIAAEHQGGLGTASSNIGNKYAMFEAIHGTAPYLMSRGRGAYADPSSLIRAAGMLLAHIGYADKKPSGEGTGCMYYRKAGGADYLYGGCKRERVYRLYH
ncbi:MAG: isocitrate/isopropylmalate family dehydrogenase [Enterocloster sp.]